MLKKSSPQPSDYLISYLLAASFDSVTLQTGIYGGGLDAGRRGTPTVVCVPRSLEDRIPKDHPLAAIRQMTDQALSALSPLFDQIYSEAAVPPSRRVSPARPSRPGALCHPFRAQALRAPGVSPAVSLVRGPRSERTVWHPTTFTQNRERLLAGDVAEAFFLEVRKQAEAGKLLSRSTSAWTHLGGSRCLAQELPAQAGTG